MGRLNRNLYVMLKFTERPKTLGITSKKTWLSLRGMKGNKLFAGDFRDNLDETNTDMVQFTKRWNWNGLSNVNLHQSLCIFKTGLSNSYDVMAGRNIKKKYLMCQITSKKTWLSLRGMKGNKLFAADFRANLDETNTDMVQFTKRWNWKWIV